MNENSDLKKELDIAGINENNFFEYKGTKGEQMQVITSLAKKQMAYIGRESKSGRMKYEDGRIQIFEIFKELNGMFLEYTSDDRFFDEGIISHRRKKFFPYFKTIYNYIMLNFKDSDDLVDKTNEVEMDAWDFNGLKAINDFSDKSSGNRYLIEGVKTLCNNEQRTKYLNDGYCSFFFTFGEGDEFNELCWGKFPGRSAYHYFVDEKIKNIDTRPFLDFSDSEVKARFADKDIAVPENASLIASIARGTISLDKILLKSIEKTPEELMALAKNRKSLYSARRNFILGAFIDSSELKCKKNKEQYYNGMKKSKDPNSRFQSDLRIRTDVEQLKKDAYTIKKNEEKLLAEVEKMQKQLNLKAEEINVLKLKNALLQKQVEDLSLQ